jgi:dCTP deaminase
VTVLAGQTIRRLGILTPCLDREAVNGLTHGLGPAGYDLRVNLGADYPVERWVWAGSFMLAATLEHFTMPPDVLGVVHDKSTWARRGLCAQNTVIEPGWRGFLTLELTNHSLDNLVIKQGMAIAQVVFHRLDEPTEQPYNGKYQDQQRGPQGAR